jgi:hypothetical protein
MTDDEIRLLLLTDTAENILISHEYRDFAVYAHEVAHVDRFVSERENIPTVVRWVLNSGRRGKHGQRSVIVGNALRVVALRVLNACPRDLVATDSVLTRLHAHLSATRGTRPDTQGMKMCLADGLMDPMWATNLPGMRDFFVDLEVACVAHTGNEGSGWALIAELYKHPNAHLRLMHMLTHKTLRGRPRLD